MQIQDLRKQKENVLKQRDQTIEANKQKEKDIESLSKQNEESNKTIRNKELTKSVVQCTNQKKFFTTSRDELSALKFISNVEDYYKLIQMFDIAMKEKAKGNTNNEIDQLRNDIKMKLENFQKEKIMNNSLYSKMKVDTKSGMNYDEIIKRTSQRIIDELSSAETVSNYQNTSNNKKVMIVD